MYDSTSGVAKAALECYAAPVKPSSKRANLELKRVSLVFSRVAHSRATTVGVFFFTKWVERYRGAH